MIDRSQFIDYLRQHPEMVERLAIINMGEVGRAPIEKQLLQLETVFNRATARGQTLEEVTRMYTGPGSKGYYPPSTFENGKALLAKNPGALDAFREKVFRPVVDGSDVSTRKLGFAATGNASDSGKNKYGEPYASGRQARGEYARTRWYQGGEKTGGKLDEMYVQEKGPLDKNERLDALRKGGPEPQPDPNTAARPGEVAPRSTGNLLADHVAGTPWEPTPEQQSALVTGVPSEPTPPVSPATPAPAAQTQSARAPAAAAPAYKPKGFPGSRDDLPYDYIDPNTGHQIVNPKGSGEEGMGVTRDIGPPPKAAAPARAAAPAATEYSPRVKTGDVFETGAPPMTGLPLVSQSTVDALPSSVPKVPLFDVPPTLPDAGPRPFDRAPFDQSAMDPTLLAQQRSIDMGPRLDEGPTPPGAITGSPAGLAPPGLMEQLGLTQPQGPADMSVNQRQPDILARPDERGFVDPSLASMAPKTAPNFLDVLSTLVTKGGPLRALYGNPGDPPLAELARQQNVDRAFSPGARNAPVPYTAGQSRSAIDQKYNDGSNLPRGFEDPSAASAFGGTRPLNMAPPRTVDQQLGGLSPFAPSPGGPTQVADNLELAGKPSPYPKPGTPWPTPKGQQPGPIMPPQPWQPPDWAAAPRPGPQMAGGLSPIATRRLGNTTDAAAGNDADMGADPTRDLQQTTDVAGLNLSPFQDWPPPWWDGGFSGGGGGFDFGGGRLGRRWRRRLRRLWRLRRLRLALALRQPSDQALKLVVLSGRHPGRWHSCRPIGALP